MLCILVIFTEMSWWVQVHVCKSVLMVFAPLNRQLAHVGCAATSSELAHFGQKSWFQSHTVDVSPQNICLHSTTAQFCFLFPLNEAFSTQKAPNSLFLLPPPQETPAAAGGALLRSGTL